MRSAYRPNGNRSMHGRPAAPLHDRRRDWDELCARIDGRQPRSDTISEQTRRDWEEVCARVDGRILS